MLHRVPRSLGTALLLAGLALLPHAVAAQLGHPTLAERGPRPLHLRLSESDALALGTIERVELGRIRVSDAVSLRGELPAGFELKRAPSAPAPLVAGDRVLLLLRGARSPYLLVDAPDEIWKLAARASEPAQAAAIRALDAARPRRDAVAEVYAEWLASQDPALARAAAQGFAGDAALFAAALARDPTLRQTLVRLASDAPDEQLRLAARRALVAR
jgi:hypothetical protein